MLYSEALEQLTAEILLAVLLAESSPYSASSGKYQPLGGFSWKCNEACTDAEKLRNCIVGYFYKR